MKVEDLKIGQKVYGFVEIGENGKIDFEGRVVGFDEGMVSVWAVVFVFNQPYRNNSTMLFARPENVFSTLEELQATYVYPGRFSEEW